MKTKHLCVLIHIWTKGEVGAPLNRFKPSSKIFLLTVPRRCFFCGSFLLFLSYFVMHSCTSFLLMPYCHLLGKCSRLWCLIVKLPLSHWYPGSGVVLDCIFLSFVIAFCIDYIYFFFGLVSFSSSCLACFMYFPLFVGICICLCFGMRYSVSFLFCNQFEEQGKACHFAFIV